MKRAILAITLCSWFIAPLARAGQIANYDIEGWSVGVYANDQTQEFTHCAASVPYRSGIAMLFAVDRNFGWSMGFFNQAWNLRIGDQFDIAYAIDNGPQITGRAAVVANGLVRIPLLDSTQLFDAFRRGNKLMVYARGGTFGFNLTNSSKALAAVLDCTKRNVAAAKPVREQNPFLAQAAPSHAVTPSPDFKPEASVIAANVLSQSGIQHFRLLPPDDIPQDFRVYDAVWSTEGGILGTVKIITPDLAGSAEEISTTLTSIDSNTCKGRFASAKQGASQGGIIRLMTACNETDQAAQVSYSIMPRGKGGFYVFAVYGLGEAHDAAKEIDSRLYEATVKFVSKR